MENYIEIYDEENNYIGYGLKGLLDDYEIYNSKGVKIGSGVNSGFANIYEIYDKSNKCIGYIEDSSLGITKFYYGASKETKKTKVNEIQTSSTSNLLNNNLFLLLLKIVLLALLSFIGIVVYRYIIFIFTMISCLVVIY